MKRSTVLLSGIFLLICFSQCRQREQQHEIYVRADSLLKLTLGLQARISAPEIQRLHDFREEVGEDLAILSPIPGKDSSLSSYLDLYMGLGRCVEACNQFHEEAFLLEIALRDIMDQVRMKDAGLENLESSFRFELENFNDLSVRIDSSLDLALRQAEIYYRLKPEINRIMEGMDTVPDQGS